MDTIGTFFGPLNHDHPAPTACGFCGTSNVSNNLPTSTPEKVGLFDVSVDTLKPQTPNPCPKLPRPESLSP